MRRQHPTSYFWNISLNHGQQRGSFTTAGRGRGSNLSNPEPGGNTLSNLFSAQRNAPQPTSTGLTGSKSVPTYSLTNFAARAQVVPLAGKGKGVNDDPPRESAPVEPAAMTTTGIPSTAQKAPISHEIFKRLPDVRGEAITVDAARNLSSNRSHSEGQSMGGSIFSSNATTKGLTPSSQAFRLSGQSLLKTLAKRATPMSRAEDAAKMSPTNPDNSDVIILDKIQDLRKHIELVRSIITAIDERKVVKWDQLPAAIQQLPAFHRRVDLAAHMRSCAAASPGRQSMVELDNAEHDNGASASSVLPPLLLTGATGCGKSIIAPLALMDLHWRGVVIGLSNYQNKLLAKYFASAKSEPLATQHSGNKVDEKDPRAAEFDKTVVPAPVRGDSINYCNVPEAFIPYFDPAEDLDVFLTEFPVRTRLRVLVSQPTRLAAKSLADFLNQSLSAATPSTFFNEPDVVTERPDEKVGNTLQDVKSKQRQSIKRLLPVGFRVGYGTALDKAISDETCEIVFSTVGYLLNRLAGGGGPAAKEYNVLTRQYTQDVMTKSEEAPSSSETKANDSHRHGWWRAHDVYAPSTIILDEAHRRDLQSDLLMAWAREWHRLGSSAPQGSLPAKRKLVIMSASMDPSMFAEYFRTDATHKISKSTSFSEKVNRNAFNIDSAITSFDMSIENRGDVGQGWVSPFPSEYRNADEIAENLLKESSGAVHVSNSPAVITPKQKTYTREVFFCDDIMNILRSISQSAHSISDPTKRQRYRDGDDDLADDDSHLSIQENPYPLATAILSRASSASLEELYTASFVANKAVSVYESAAQVAVQCVAANENVLIFVPGFDELLSFVVSVAKHTNTPIANINISQKEDNFDSSSAEGVSPAMTYLQKGTSVLVDVIALHASAIGEASAQLRSSKSSAKIIVATNVAESSITIPNVSLVLNTGLERVSSSLGGNTRLITRVSSKSSFVQREGRTGRTCDGVVLHLLPKSLFDKTPNFALSMWQESGETTSLLLAAKLLFPPTSTKSEIDFDATKLQQRTTKIISISNHQSKLLSSDWKESLPNFTLSSLCANLPAPILQPNALLASAGNLCDAGVLSEPEGVIKANVGDRKSDAQAKEKLAWVLLDGTALTFKGRFIASLPLTTSLAQLVYHGFMYGSLDAALITACAMETNITTMGSGRLETIPLDVYESGMKERFKLAADCPNDVWLNFCIMDTWYNTQMSDKFGFSQSVLVRFKSLLRADELVAMCCAKLLDILTPMLTGVAESTANQPLGTTDKRSRQVLKRIRLLRKHALINTTLLRSSSRNSFLQSVAPFPKCANPDDGLNVGLQTRLRAAFINSFYKNVLVGNADNSSVATSATLYAKSMPPLGKELASGGDPSLAFISAKLMAGIRTLPPKFYANITPDELIPAIGRLFASSKTISFQAVKLLPSRGSVMIKLDEGHRPDEGDSGQLEDGGEGSPNRDIVRPDNAGGGPQVYFLETTPLKGAHLRPSSAVNGGTPSHDSAIESPAGIRLKQAPFPLWLIHSMPNRLRDVRMPMKKLQSNVVDQHDEDEEFMDFREALDEDEVIAAGDNQDHATHSSSSGVFVTDKRTGVQTHFQLKRETAETLVGDDEDAAPALSNAASGLSPSNSIDLLHASALGYNEWSPSRAKFMEATSFLEAVKNRKSNKGRPSSVPSELELASTAKPWKSVEAHLNNSRTDIISNTFLRVGSVSVPDAIRWVARVSPKSIVGSVVRHATSAFDLTQEQQSSRQLIDKENLDVEAPLVTENSVAPPVTDVTVRIMCPVCCRSIPLATKALHVTRPSHLRNLQRLVAAGTPKSSLGRIIPTNADPSAMAQEVSKSLKTSSATPQMRRLLVETITAQSAQRQSDMAELSNEKETTRLRDLVPSEDREHPIPASLNATSLNSLLVVTKQPTTTSVLVKSTADAVAFATSVSVRTSGSIAAVGTWVADPTNHSDALTLLQAAILNEATVARPIHPLMLLFNSKHSLVYGYCVVGLYCVSFGNDPLKPSSIQQLLEVKQGAKRSSALFEVADEEFAAEHQTSASNGTTQTGPPLAPLSVGGSAVTRLQEVLQRGLSSLDFGDEGQSSATTGNSHTDDGERHWCPLIFPCQARHNEYNRIKTERHLQGTATAASSPPPSALGWSPTNPIEVAVSNTILVLLHESQLTGHRKQHLTRFTHRLLHNLSLVAKNIGISSKVKTVSVELEVLQPQGQQPPEGGRTKDVAVEIGSGVRLLEGFIKLRGADSLEQVLLYCGCIFTTTYLDGCFMVPPVLPTAIPAPSLVEWMSTGGQ